MSVGPFALQLGDVIDWYLRARDGGARIEMMPETLLFRRVHDSNMSRTGPAEKGEYARILKASLDRRRAAK